MEEVEFLEAMKALRNKDNYTHLFLTMYISVNLTCEVDASP